MNNTPTDPGTSTGTTAEATGTQRQQGRFFFGWYIVAVSCVQGMFGNGAISTGFPRFFEPIRNGPWHFLRRYVPGIQPGPSRGRLGRSPGWLAGRQVRFPSNDPFRRADRRGWADAPFLCPGILAVGIALRWSGVSREDSRTGPNPDGYREPVVCATQGGGPFHPDDRFCRPAELLWSPCSTWALFSWVGERPSL